MVTTRSGKETAGATKPALPATKSGSATNDPRPPAKKRRLHTKEPQRPAKKRSPVGVEHSPTTVTTPTTAATTSPGPLSKIPVEILYLIAKSLPPAKRDRLFMASTPRPSQLYPLATSCKGFWECLRPLLFEFDIALGVKNYPSTRVPQTSSWDHCGVVDPKSALAWGLENNQTSTAELAIKVAQSMGKLRSYTFVSHYHHRVLPSVWTLWRASSIYDVDARLDPLSLAIVKGNVRIAELLVQDADNSVLSRAWPHRDLFWMRHDVEFLMTPLNLAIWAGEYGIAKLLLQRFSELDPSTLQWNEPTGLGLAAYLGDVKMARLMLDGGARPKGGTPASRGCHGFGACSWTTGHTRQLRTLTLTRTQSTILVARHR